MNGRLKTIAPRKKAKPLPPPSSRGYTLLNAIQGDALNTRGTSQPITILGFGAAAISAVLALRASRYRGPIRVITDGAPEPYSPVLTSYYAGGRLSRRQCNPWADLDILHMVDELCSQTHIRSVIPSDHMVELEDGRRLRYSKLVIATGAHPVAPGFPLPDGCDPLALRTMDDAERLKRALEREDCRNVLIAGTSMVALKVLEACLGRNVRPTLLGRSQHILRNSAHPLIATKLEWLLEQRGVSLRLHQAATKCEHSAAQPRYLVAFDQGDNERYDEVVLAQGVKPNLAFAEGTPLEIDQGLIVDRFMRTNIPDVLAAGDVAQALDLATGTKRVIGLWRNAVQQGRCAGRVIAAELAGNAPSPAYLFPGSVPANVIHVNDILFASAGSMNKGENRHLEIRETEHQQYALVYEEHENADYLVGFNLLSVITPNSSDSEVAEQIGRYNAEIRKHYLAKNEELNSSGKSCPRQD